MEALEVTANGTKIVKRIPYDPGLEAVIAEFPLPATLRHKGMGADENGNVYSVTVHDVDADKYLPSRLFPSYARAKAYAEELAN